MALVSIHHPHLFGTTGLWEIVEEEDYFYKRLVLSPLEEEELSRIKGNRRKQWLAGRWLMHIISKDRERIDWIKDEMGKPHINGEGEFISISHSGPWVAAIIHSQMVGIDVQVKDPRLEKISQKYLSLEENAWIPRQSRNVYLAVIWGAKESVYKAWGKKGISFRQHIDISPFNLVTGLGRGTLETPDGFKQFKFGFSSHSDFQMVFAVIEP